MTMRKACLAVAGLSGVAVLAFAALGAELGSSPLAATVIGGREARSGAVVPEQKPAPITAEATMTKRTIEAPAKTVLRDHSAVVNQSTGSFVNPKVQPGRVEWHATFAAACAASRRSHKPVLLFQLMGKLDDQFC